MRHIPAALQAHLDTGTTTLCHCWRLTRKDGVVLGFTDHDRALEFDGLTFAPDSGFTAGTIDSGAGLSVDNVEIDGVLSSDTLTEADLEQGRYDDAEIDLFIVNWAAPLQRVLMFRGSLGETTRGTQSFRAELRGMAHRLDQPIGRVFQRRCDAELGDARCGISLTPLLAQIDSVAPDGTLTISALIMSEDAEYAQGTVRWVTGANIGATSHIRAQTRDQILLWAAPAAQISPGDQVQLGLGCDKRFQTCQDRFSNAINFQGFPFMPGDDVLLRVPRDGDLHDGAAL